jgi:hypothetical protein
MTSDDVWQQYRALYTYVTWPVGKSRIGQMAPQPNPHHKPGFPALHPTALLSLYQNGTAAPLPPSPKTEQSKEAAKRLSWIVPGLRNAWPVADLDDDDFVYCYLFAQLLRVSYPVGPHFIDAATGWTNLLWRPLSVLAPPVGDGAIRYWKRFYVQNGGSAGIAARFRDTIPRLDRPVVQDAILWTAHAKALVALLAEGLSADHIFTRLTPAGELRQSHGVSGPAWHPLVQAARPETWHPEADGVSRGRKNHRIAQAVLALLSARTCEPLAKFLRTIVPACNPAPTKQLWEDLKQGFASVVEQFGDDTLRKSWCARKKTTFDTARAGALANSRQSIVLEDHP